MGPDLAPARDMEWEQWDTDLAPRDGHYTAKKTDRASSPQEASIFSQAGRNNFCGLISAGTCWIRDFLQTKALLLPFCLLPGTSLIRLLRGLEDLDVGSPIPAGTKGV